MNVREIALRLLGEYEAGGKFVNLSLSSHLADKLSREERAFLTVLLYTTVENKLKYDYYIGALAGRSLDKIKAVIEANSGRPVPQWIDVNADNQEAKIIALPNRDQIDAPVEEQLIVEFYSK